MFELIKSADYNYKETRLYKITQTIKSFILNNNSVDFRIVEYTYPKVVQKSYGQEKRFFCPAPQIYIKGGYRNFTAVCYVQGCSKNFLDLSENQDSYRDNSFMFNSPNEARNSSSFRESTIYTGTFEIDDICSFKSIHFNDDQQRYIRITVRVLRKDGSTLGTFISDFIKVISKPSKKKNVTNRNSEMLIKSASPVVLFSRVRTHAYNTRYLNVCDNRFISASNRWSSIGVYLIKNGNREFGLNDSKDELISYGDTIKLVCPISKFTLPELIIYKVESYSVIKIPNENLSQLHRVALAIKGENNVFLSIEEDIIRKRQILPGKDNEIELPESTCWSIVTTGKMRSAFISPNNFQESITPIPKVIKIEEIYGVNRTLEIFGENFTTDMLIFIGDVSLETTYIDKTQLKIVINESVKLAIHSGYNKNTDLFIVKCNGSIYPTGFRYIYR